MMLTKQVVEAIKILTLHMIPEDVRQSYEEALANPPDEWWNKAPCAECAIEPSRLDHFFESILTKEEQEELWNRMGEEVCWRINHFDRAIASFDNNTSPPTTQ